MAEDRHSQRTPPAAGDAVTGVAQRFWLDHAGRVVDLPMGVVLIGRSSGCHIILDDALVSRRHAELVVGPHTVAVQDFGSVNGVFVNGRRISGSERLTSGDQLQLGTQVMTLRSGPQSFRAGSASGPRPLAETMRRVEVPEHVRQLALASSVPNETEATFSAHTLDLLGGVAEKVLALGRGDDAEKVLSTTLTNILNEVTRGSSAPPQVVEKAAHYALRIAEVTGKGRWADYTIELYAALKRPLPASQVDALYALLRKIDGINLATLRAYLAQLRDLQQNFGPAERFVLQRLEGFERLAALK